MANQVPSVVPPGPREKPWASVLCLEASSQTGSRCQWDGTEQRCASEEAWGLWGLKGFEKKGLLFLCSMGADSETREGTALAWATGYPAGSHTSQTSWG